MLTVCWRFFFSRCITAFVQLLKPVILELKTRFGSFLLRHKATNHKKQSLKGEKNLFKRRFGHKTKKYYLSAWNLSQLFYCINYAHSITHNFCFPFSQIFDLFCFHVTLLQKFTAFYYSTKIDVIFLLVIFDA